MNYILEQNLNKKILSDGYEYFFTFLFDRFEYAVELWITELEKKFTKKFKPIWILSAKQNDLFKKENYIVINKKLKEYRERLSGNEVIYLEDYDDLNREFSESEFVLDLISELIKKQGRIFILPFTSSYLNFENSNVIILGPDPKIAAKFSNKITHLNLFKELGLPVNQNEIYNSISEIKTKVKYPFYISASYTTGGNECGIIYSEEDLDFFCRKLRETNKSNSFIVSKLITEIKISPNVNAVVCKEDDTRIICITDQILRGNQYQGNIYPSKANYKETEEIINATKKVGNHLSKFGFRGLFGIDFIIDSNDQLYCVDLNPRRQGGYLCNILMSGKINIPGIELDLILGETILEFDFEDFNLNYAWAHTKIVPYTSNMKIKNILKKDFPYHPFRKVGSEYKAIFYPVNYFLANGYAGYFIVSGHSYENVMEKIEKETKMLITNNFELDLPSLKSNIKN